MDSSIYVLLNQDKIWIDRQGVKHEVHKMDSNYRENILRFLLHRAEPLFWAYAFGEAIHIDAIEAAFGPPDDFDIPSVLDEYEQVRVFNYEKWLKTTPLMRALA